MSIITNWISNINIIVIIPLILTCIELVQIHKTRTAEILYNIFNDIHTTDNMQNIEWLYTMDLSNYSILTTENKRRIDDTIDVFTRISFLCEKKLLPKKYILQMYSGLIIHVWQHAQQYIISKRTATGITNYAIYFEKMYKRSLKYRTKHNYDVYIH